MASAMGRSKLGPSFRSVAVGSPRGPAFHPPRLEPDNLFARRISLEVDRMGWIRLVRKQTAKADRPIRDDGLLIY